MEEYYAENPDELINLVMNESCVASENLIDNRSLIWNIITLYPNKMSSLAYLLNIMNLKYKINIQSRIFSFFLTRFVDSEIEFCKLSLIPDFSEKQLDVIRGFRRLKEYIDLLQYQHDGMLSHYIIRIKSTIVGIVDTYKLVLLIMNLLNHLADFNAMIIVNSSYLTVHGYMLFLICQLSTHHHLFAPGETNLRVVINYIKHHIDIAGTIRLFSTEALNLEVCQIVENL